jgi:O-antigen/teichoic acid export membrane protein
MEGAGFLIAIVIAIAASAWLGWDIDPYAIWGAGVLAVVLLVVAPSIYRDIKKHPRPRRRRD